MDVPPTVAIALTNGCEGAARTRAQRRLAGDIVAREGLAAVRSSLRPRHCSHPVVLKTKTGATPGSHSHALVELPRGQSAVSDRHIHVPSDIRSGQ
jgi:hypothetical protein